VFFSSRPLRRVARRAVRPGRATARACYRGGEVQPLRDGASVVSWRMISPPVGMPCAVPPPIVGRGSNSCVPSGGAARGGQVNPSCQAEVALVHCGPVGNGNRKSGSRRR